MSLSTLYFIALGILLLLVFLIMISGKRLTFENHIIPFFGLSFITSFVICITILLVSLSYKGMFYLSNSAFLSFFTGLMVLCGCGFIVFLLIDKALEDN